MLRPGSTEAGRGVDANALLEEAADPRWLAVACTDRGGRVWVVVEGRRQRRSESG